MGYRQIWFGGPALFLAAVCIARPVDACRREVYPREDQEVAAWRGMGPSAVLRLIAGRDRATAVLPDAVLTPEQQTARQTELAAWNTAIDRVAGAKYSHVSGLYWYTDWNTALAAARRENKPILSLRLLGNLSDELSCANSRFFRTTLYPHADVSKVLRERYILYWQSVRPAPVITIDFGDGRKIVRTITGNSIHYVVSPADEVIDALPGLYGPKAFLDRLTAAADECASLAQTGESAERTQRLTAYREEQIRQASAAWDRDWKAIAEHLPAGAIAGQVGQVPAGMAPEEFWKQLGALRPEESALDMAGVTFVQAMQPPAARAMRLAVTKSLAESPAMRLVRNLQTVIGADTAHNSYAFRPQILAWMNASEELRNLDILNNRIYAELFLTPAADPWLGLQTPDAFAALPNGGAVLPPPAQTSK